MVAIYGQEAIILNWCPFIFLHDLHGSGKHRDLYRLIGLYPFGIYPIVTVNSFADIVLGQKLDVHKGESRIATEKKYILYPLPTYTLESGVVNQINLSLGKIVSIKFVKAQFETSKRVFVQPF